MEMILWDADGLALNVSNNYAVNTSGQIVQMNSETIQIIGLQSNLYLTGLSLSHSWLSVIGADLGDASQWSPFYEVDELWIRAYPDDIFMQTHEEDLTPKEHQAGLDYWAIWWAAAGNKEKELVAWRDLVALFGEQRAAWIAKHLMPTNYASAVIINPVFQVNNQAVLMQTFTNQIAVVSSYASQKPSLPNYLSIYNAQVNAMVETSGSIEGAPAQFADMLSNNVTALQAGFNSLGDTLLGVDPELETSINQITNGIASLTDNVSALNILNSWADLYSQTPAFPTVDIKDDNWIAQPRTKVLPDRLIFATIDDDSDAAKTRIEVINSGEYDFKHIKIGN